MKRLQLSSAINPSGFASSPNLLSLKTITTPISISTPAPTTPASPPLTMSYDQESDIFEDITLNFKLPDGSSFTLKAKSGDTVQEVKRKLDTSKGIASRASSLFWEGKYMMDPLSLNDIPGLVAKNEVQIEVKISQNAQASPPIQHHLQQQHPQQYHQHFEGLKKQYIEDMQGKSYNRAKSAVFTLETTKELTSPTASSIHNKDKESTIQGNGHSSTTSPFKRATIQPLPLNSISIINVESETIELHVPSSVSPKNSHISTTPSRNSSRSSSSASRSASFDIPSIQVQPEQQTQQQETQQQTEQQTQQTEQVTENKQQNKDSVGSSSSSVTAEAPVKVNTLTPSLRLLHKSIDTESSSSSLSTMSSGVTSSSSSPSTHFYSTGKTAGKKMLSLNLSASSLTNSPSSSITSSPSLREFSSGSGDETKEEKKERKKKEKIEKRISRRMSKIAVAGEEKSPRLKPLEDMTPVSKKSCIVM